MTQALPPPPSPALTPATITLDQYHRMVEAGIWNDRHVELLNGVVIETAPEGAPHASDSSRTGEFLSTY